jgi:SAM-dependent methyltransferase
MTQVEAALALFRKSVLKQAKFRQISSLLEDPRDRANLDLGGDNGILSFLLRQKGGTWSSGDLDEKTVGSIRSLVGDRVYRLDGAGLPFPDESLDQIVVIDYLEHVREDKAAVQEFRRVLKQEGILIINVPRPKPGSLLTRTRHALGLTDEWHGHVRPGYTEEELKALLAPEFELETVRTYSRSFSEAIDTGLNGVYERLRGRGQSSSRKGTVITGQDMQTHQRAFRLMSLLHPILWAVSQLDWLLFGQTGYKMVARARLSGSPIGASPRHHRMQQARDIAPALPSGDGSSPHGQVTLATFQPRFFLKVLTRLLAH